MTTTATRRDFMAGLAALVGVAMVPPLVLRAKTPCVTGAPFDIEVLDCGVHPIQYATKWDAHDNEVEWSEFKARVHQLRGVAPCCGQVWESHAQTDVVILRLCGDERKFLIRELEPHRESIQRMYEKHACP